MTAHAELVHQLQCQGANTERAANEIADAHRAEVLAADGQAYDGELAMLRGLVRTLRAAARNGDLPAMQQALIHHANDDAEAREKTTAPSGGGTPDTLAAWLYQRFAVIHGAPPWDLLSDDSRAYWEHHARAVRRAVARGGFKTDTTQGDSK